LDHADLGLCLSLHFTQHWQEATNSLVSTKINHDSTCPRVSDRMLWLQLSWSNKWVTRFKLSCSQSGMKLMVSKIALALLLLHEAKLTLLIKGHL